MEERILERPRGTRDFSPEEMRIRREVERRLREIFESYGYEEIATPTFEHASMFVKRSGERVLEELYFFEDKGGRKLILRPELTLPTIRFYYSELLSKPKPLRLYYFENVFRYEEPQKGRYREFWHFGCEVIGGEKFRTFLEGIDLIWAVLKEFGIEKETRIRYGDVDLLREYLRRTGIGLSKEILRAIDKKDLEKLKALLGRKYEDLRKFLEGDLEYVSSKGRELANKVKDLKKLGKALSELGIRAELDPGIVRGWDYYVDLVFEVDAPWLGAEKQICGGGFYDLSGVFEKPKEIMFGFAIGFDRLIDALREIGKLPMPNEREKALVLPLCEKAFIKALKVARELRELGVVASLEIRKRNVRRALEYANALGYSYLVIIGKKELEEGKISIKDLRKKEQKEVSTVSEYFEGR